ncbi:MAG: hypothetical protein ACYC3G_00585 [Minisyncoccota bacterium]
MTLDFILPQDQNQNNIVQELTCTSLLHIAVSVTQVATKLCVGAAAAAGRRKVRIHNTDAALTIYLGGSGVTTANGFPLKFGEHVEFNLSSGVELYGIAGTGETVNVRVLEEV